MGRHQRRRRPTPTSSPAAPAAESPQVAAAPASEAAAAEPEQTSLLERFAAEQGSSGEPAPSGTPAWAEEGHPDERPNGQLVLPHTGLDSPPANPIHAESERLEVEDLTEPTVPRLGLRDMVSGSRPAPSDAAREVDRAEAARGYQVDPHRAWNIDERPDAPHRPDLERSAVQPELPGVDDPRAEGHYSFPHHRREDAAPAAPPAAASAPEAAARPERGPQGDWFEQEVARAEATDQRTRLAELEGSDAAREARQVQAVEGASDRAGAAVRRLTGGSTRDTGDGFATARDGHSVEYNAEDNRTHGSVRLGRAHQRVDRESSQEASVGVNSRGQAVGHVEVASSRRDAVVPEDERSTDDTSHRVGWTGDAVELRRTRGQVVRDEDGRRASENQATVRVGRDRLELGGRNRRERDLNDGSGDRRRTDLTGSVDVRRRRATVGFDASRRGANGQERSGVAASGTVDLDENGDLEEVSVSGEARWRGWEVSADYSYQISAADPVPVYETVRRNGVERREISHYTVAWRRQHRVGGGLSAGERNGGGGSYHYEALDNGVQRFDSASEAREFADNILQHIDEVAGAPRSGDAALGMEEGESVRESTSHEGGVNGHVSTMDGFLNVGGTLGAEHEESREVTRGGHGTDAYVDVETRTSDLHRWGVSLSTLGLGLGTNSEDQTEVAVTLRFFVGTPEGREAYDHFLHDQPLGERGWESRAHENTDTETDGTTFNLLAGEAGTEGEVQDTVATDENGRRSRRIRGRQTTTTSGFGDSSFEQTEFRAGVPAEGSGRAYYRLATRARGSDGDAVEDDLVRATGVGRSGAPARASGNWTIEQRLRPAEVDRFARRVRSGEANILALLGDSGAGEDLRERLVEVEGNREEEARAIAEFISETGGRGMAWLRDTAGVHGRTEVRLEGDRFLRGGAAKRALEGRVARYWRQLADPSANRLALARNIMGDLHGLRARLTAVQDRERYQDLPEALREQEIEWTEGQIQSLEMAHQQVTVAPPAPEAEEGEAAEEGEEGSRAARRPARPRPQPFADSRVTELQAQVETARARATLADRRVTLSRRIHLRGDFRGMGPSSIPYERYGPSGGVLWTEGSETAAYERAGTAAREGRRLMRAARQCQRSAETHRTEGALTTGEQRSFHHRQLVLYLRTMISTYGSAAQQLERAEAEYQGIRRRHPDQPATWAGYRSHAVSDAQ